MTPLSGRDPDVQLTPPSWGALGEFLGKDLVLFAPGRREAWLREWKDLSDLEANLDDRLIVGLVGGTGVGKSTLINALAGSEISATGERRPTTDLVIAYRHEATPLPDDVPRDVLSDPEVTHCRAALERTLVLDFPDFDSVEEVHQRILQRCMPHIDVLLVVVDDMKYGDLRLFQLLRSISQSSENLHVVLNKVDRLRLRYGERGPMVAGEIIDDLIRKLEAHAGVDMQRRRCFAISAAHALGRDGGQDSGEFSGIVALLEGYREAKRRRAAKELNLEARKEALARSVAAAALDPDVGRRADRAVTSMVSRASELSTVLGGISVAIFSTAERRRLVSTAVSASPEQFGLPVDLILTLCRGLRLRRGGAPETAVEFSSSRIRAHYRAYVEGVENALRDVEIEVGDFLPGEPTAAAPSAAGGAAGPSAPWARSANFAGPIARAGEDLQGRFRAAREAAARSSQLWNHALPGAVLLLFVWSRVFPVLRQALGRALGEEDRTWGGVFRELVFSILGVLDPLFLSGLVLCLVLAYLVTAAVLWARRAQKIERILADEERAVRARIVEHAGAVLGAATGTLRRWLAERSELARIVRAVVTVAPATGAEGTSAQDAGGVSG